MEKFNFVFLINDNNKWQHVFGYIDHLTKHTEKVDKIAVVATDTAVLSCLIGTKIDWFNKALKDALDKKVEFSVCISTIHKYNLDMKSILPALSVAMEGGILKATEYQAKSYYLYQL